MKAKAQEAVTTAKRVIANAETFVQATALLVLAIFSYNQLHKAQLSEVIQWVITGSLVIVAFRAFYEYYRFLNK